MQTWQEIAMIAGISAGALILTVVLVALCSRCQRNKSKSQKRRQRYAHFSGTSNGLDIATEGTHMAAKWRKLYPVKPFLWSDNPALVADATRRGWAAFSMTYSCSSQCPVSSANTLVLCTKCCLGEAFQPEISWEIGAGADYMQLIRLNPRVKRGGNHSQEGVLIQALQSALPLPGPSLRAFPQEAYFEVTIVACGDRISSSATNSVDSDNVKLILEASPSEKYSLSSVSRSHHVLHGQNSTTKGIVQARIQGSRRNKVEAEDCENRILGAGFSAGISPPFRFPGADPGSVGLLSNGRVLVNGTVLESSEPLDSEAGKWGALPKTTIGCGFAPQPRKAFFTLNGELVREVKCGSSWEFSHPLHAVVASNCDVTLLVNYGQCSFEFLPANNQRLADPTTFRTNSSSVNSHKLIASIDDSGDLFSIRRLDSRRWWSAHSSSPTEAEADLFEIPLDVRA